MRHRKAGRRLGRSASHRLAMFRNMTMALIRHESIITTQAKAKEVRPFVEKLITLARKGSLHARRMVVARLGPSANAEVKPGDDKDADHRSIVQKLFSDLGPRFKDRPGGYTRIIKRHERRLGDGGFTALLELLKPGEVKVRTKAPAAPRIEDEDETTQPEQHKHHAESETPAASETPHEGATAEQQPAPAGENPLPNQ